MCVPSNRGKSPGAQTPRIVTLANAGGHKPLANMDSRLRGNDGAIEVGAHNPQSARTFAVTVPNRHGRTCSGHPRLVLGPRKRWMAATSAAMTAENVIRFQRNPL